MLGTCETEDIDYSELARITEGYSGSDINLVCREAAMRPLRLLFEKLDESVDGDETIFKPASVTMMDLAGAVKGTKSSSSEKGRGRYEKWQDDFGSV